MLAARQQDFEAMRRQYEGVDDIILTIDGLQPEKGHETLYVVRELTQKRDRKGVRNWYIPTWAAGGDEASYPGRSRNGSCTFAPEGLRCQYE
jgi:hypothetical protein